DAALGRQLADLPRADIATASLCDHGAGVLVRDRSAMIDAANAYASEHVALLVERPREMADAIVSAGAIFDGTCTPEAASASTAGPSHDLPAAGAARFGSPLGDWVVVKHTSVLGLDAAALAAQAEASVTLARAEGLEGHARAVERRTASRKGEP